MRSLSSPASQRILCMIFLAASFAVASSQLTCAQEQALAAPSPSSQPLITQPVDESRLTVLKGNTHPLARPQFDLGSAPPTLPMQRMLLVLKRSQRQEAALRLLLDTQQAKSSPSYHKWLTPKQFGKQFGPTDADIQTITTWLQSHGFQVGSTKGRTVLEFSGSAAQVQEAFHTAIHKYVVNEEQHWANSTDPSIPTALAPAVAGVLTLHNFLKKPQIHLAKQPVAAKIVPGKKPQVTFPAQNGQPITYALAPQDYATIYNINPPYNTGVTGGGVTIGVIGRSNLYNGGEDVSDFRSYAFNLCCGNFTVVVNGPDPGDLGADEEGEATLDSTWSGAIAYNASVEFVVSASTNTSDGIDLSEIYIIENNLTSIMTESFSGCELLATDAELSGTYALAEQAAAQGITYFVSTGDDGAEGCDDPSSPPATHPVSLNMLASTPFDIGVGGTMFNENGDDAKYWGSEAPVEESAISYIPEDVWNESSATEGLWAGSGGASAGNLAAGGTTGGVPKPTWQSGVTGIPSDGVRDLPDVSLTAASHDPYLLCLEGSCQPNSQGEISIYFVSGTSAAAPSFAGIMGLVDQQMANLNPTLGPRQGHAGYVLYRLAASENATLSQCNASNTTLPATTCIFNDVTIGNNAVPGELNYGTTSADYQAGTGYDMATGLGSVNVANLVTQWNTVSFNPTTTTLSLGASAIPHGSPMPFTVTVKPSSGSGVPSGDVSLIAVTAPNGVDGVFFTVGSWTLNGGSVSSSADTIPGGNVLMSAYYAGDTTFAPSSSAFSDYFTVTPEPSTTTLSVLTFTSNGTQLNFTGGPFGSFVYLRADVAGLSGHGTPTGYVTFYDNTFPLGNVYELNGGDQINNGSYTATPNGIVFDTGNHSISASYSGDTSFNGSNSAQSISFTIQPGFFAAVPSNNSTVIISTPGGSGSSSVSVSSSTGFSGTVSLACSGLPTGAACLFSPSSIITPGTYATSSSAITVTTAAATALLKIPRHNYLARWLAAESFVFFSVVLLGCSRRRRNLPLLLMMLAIIASVPACGGGGGSSTPPPITKPATPTGTYNVTVSATSGSSTSTTGFTLIVQ